MKKIIRLGVVGAVACLGTVALGTANASAAAATTIPGDGTYLVGVDIAPGTYKTTGPWDEYMGCGWERLSGLSGKYSDVIASDYTHSNQVLVTISPSDTAFKAEDCGTWQRIGPTNAAPSKTPESGQTVQSAPKAESAPKAKDSTPASDSGSADSTLSSDSGSAALGLLGAVGSAAVGSAALPLLLGAFTGE